LLYYTKEEWLRKYAALAVLRTSKTNTTMKLDGGHLRRAALRLSIIIAGALVAPNATQATDASVGLFDTGVDASGNMLPLYSVDPHYVLSGPATTAYAQADFFMWNPAPDGIRWIGPNNTSDTGITAPGGYYDYSLTFDLSGFDASHVEVSGSWEADNSAQLFLNSQDTGISVPLDTFNHLEPFTVQQGFVQGINVFNFKVFNGYATDWGNPVSLLVSGLTLTVVPEPSTFVLGGLGVLGLTLRRAFRRVA
jgi:hypothetical protein